MRGEQQAAEREAPVLTRRNGRILRVTLNRPGSANALSLEVLARLDAIVRELAADESVSAVVIEGAGPAFCAGHDLQEIRAQADPRFHYRLASACNAVMLGLAELPQPVIARVHGAAVAAGCQLVATCDLAIASSAARFATPGVNIGVWCSMPMVAISRRMLPKHALQFLMTGRMHDAQTALRLGLVNEVVAPEALDEAVNSLASELAEKSRFTLALGKQAFYRQLEMGVRDAYEYTANLAVRNNLADDAREGVSAFLERRKPRWQGS